MQSLFEHSITPLASLLRPEKLDDLVGQSHLIGDGRAIRKFIEAGRLPSILLWGPPGCGKTSLARVIANSLEADFYHLSAVLAKKEDVIKIIAKAQSNFKGGRQTILFLDEIHRWTKSQQDVLLPWVEKGIVTLIGATTENPSFTVINALLSRCRTYILEPITPEEVTLFIEKNMGRIQERYPHLTLPHPLAPSPSEKGNSETPSPLGEGRGEVLALLAKLGNGDLRNTLNLLETACILQGTGELSRENILEAGSKSLMYDQDGEEHHNLISAMHKSLRDSDGDAAIYWIGRMLAGGEDPRYIVRRMMNFASEDIYDPQAIILTNSVYDICEKMGMPECELPILNAAYYLANAPKDNSVYMAMQAMHSDIREYGNLGVPLHLRNAPTPLMKEAGYGKGYEYVHDLPDLPLDKVSSSPLLGDELYRRRGMRGIKKSKQEHFPEELKGRKYRKVN